MEVQMVTTTIIRGLFMSWGYWGIVAGLLSMVAVFFVCMEIVYAQARKNLGDMNMQADGLETASRTISRHAA
jgi:hypothetical protein